MTVRPRSLSRQSVTDPRTAVVTGLVTDRRTGPRTVATVLVCMGQGDAS